MRFKTPPNFCLANSYTSSPHLLSRCPSCPLSLLSVSPAYTHHILTYSYIYMYCQGVVSLVSQVRIVPQSRGILTNVLFCTHVFHLSSFLCVIPCIISPAHLSPYLNLSPSVMHYSCSHSCRAWSIRNITRQKWVSPHPRYCGFGDGY